MNAKAYPHLNDLAQAAILLPVPERSKWTCRDRFIVHEQISAIFKIVRMLVCSEGRVRARGLIVSGVGGSGKTMIANAILREYPELGSTDEEEASQRVVRITMTNAREASKIFSRTLRAMGCPNIASYSHDEREELVVELLKAANTRLLIIDEIQDLLKRSDAQRENAFEGIKFLMNEASVNVLALGTDRAEMTMMREEHLVTRFRSLKLAKWRVGPLLANFLDELESSLPLPERSRLSLPATQRLLVKESKGRLDLIVERVVFAAALAIENGVDRVDMGYLERSATEIPEYFAGRVPDKKSPREAAPQGIAA
ncbi:TniB family NTP-binding protein [Luteibacter sp. 3190]|uniref:TniB family NTP-binding protein n=1 Tax=Luteibacter sp. 3190 TaxID=2817736 RepID=UPI0028653932|nr:TniB family NTP-binding protein [Luteibacter sp. 3190]MDR6935721.1 hypothetical protein [Luteibacter sp. 3190]